MAKRIAEVLCKQFVAQTNLDRHSTIYFYIEKNHGLPESIVHVETSRKRRWWAMAMREGFAFQRRLRPLTAREFYKCIKRVDTSDIYIFTRGDDIICQNNHTRKFILRCIEEISKFYDMQDNS